MTPLPVFNPSLPPSAAPVAAGPPVPASAALGEMAAPAPGGPFFLPDGRTLVLSLAVKIWMGKIFGDEGSDSFYGPVNSTQDVVLLFLSAHPPEVWLAPGLEEGRTLPLVQRPISFQIAVAHFAGELGAMSVKELGDLAQGLWAGEHVTQVFPKKKAAPPRVRKKTAGSLPTGASNT